MKTTFSLFIFLFWTIFGLSQDEIDSLSLVSWPCEIKLTHIDDKCGEWGGDSEIIRVFQKNCEGKFYIEYKKRIMDCNTDPITHYQRKDFDEKKVVLSTNEDRKLIKICIAELKKMKISNKIVITQSGIINEVTSSDSTLNIKDYPSKEWLAFNKLKKLIEER